MWSTRKESDSWTVQFELEIKHLHSQYICVFRFSVTNSLHSNHADENFIRTWINAPFISLLLMGRIHDDITEFVRRIQIIESVQSYTPTEIQ